MWVLAEQWGIHSCFLRWLQWVEDSTCLCGDTSSGNVLSFSIDFVHRTKSISFLHNSVSCLHQLNFVSAPSQLRSFGGPLQILVGVTVIQRKGQQQMGVTSLPQPSERN